jgi:hypothetical protein
MIYTRFIYQATRFAAFSLLPLIIIVSGQKEKKTSLQAKQLNNNELMNTLFTDRIAGFVLGQKLNWRSVATYTRTYVWFTTK